MKVTLDVPLFFVFDENGIEKNVTQNYLENAARRQGLFRYD